MHHPTLYILNPCLMDILGADTLSQIGHPTKSQDKDSIGQRTLDWKTWKAIYSQRLPSNPGIVMMGLP